MEKPPAKKSRRLLLGIIAVIIVVAAGVLGYWTYTTTVAPEKKVVKMAVLFEGTKDEPYGMALHNAMVQAEKELGIVYSYAEIDPVDCERVARKYAEEKYDIIWAHGYGLGDGVKKAAVDYPNVVFMHGDGFFEPIKPNVGLYTSHIYQSTYLAGIIAGGMTKTNVIGVVAAFPVPLVNAYINTFIMGAKSVNSDVKVKLIWLENWWDPALSKEAGYALIDDYKVDVIYCERFGAEAAAQDRGVYAIGYILDTYETAPKAVLTSTLWNLYPLVRDTYMNYTKGIWQPLDLRPDMLAKNYTSLSPYHDFDQIIPSQIKEEVETAKQQIISGQLVLPVNMEEPIGD